MTIVSDNKIPKLWESVTCYLSNSKITEDSSSVFQIDSSISLYAFVGMFNYILSPEMDNSVTEE